MNWASLDQIIKKTLLPPKKDGTRSSKNLGDETARKIEFSEGLGEGWFDAPTNVSSNVLWSDKPDVSSESPLPIQQCLDGLSSHLLAADVTTRTAAGALLTALAQQPENPAILEALCSLLASRPFTESIQRRA